MAKGNNTPDLNAIRKNAERKEKVQPYLEFIDEKYSKEDYNWHKVPDPTFETMLKKMIEKSKGTGGEESEKKYSAEELKAEVLKQTGDIDSIVNDKIDKILEIFKAGQSTTTPQAVIEKVISNEKEATHPVVLELEKEFEERGVGVENLTFKTIPSRGASLKSLTLKTKAIINRKGKVIQMLATPSADSPFRSSQPDDIVKWAPLIEPIFFMANKPTDKEGRIYVPASNPCLQKYLLAHPKYGKLFIIEDKKADATALRVKMQAGKILSDKIEEVMETEEMRIMATGILGHEGAYTLSYDELYMELNNMLARDSELYKRLTEDRNNVFKFAFAKFHRSGAINSTGMRMTVANSLFYDGAKTTESPVDAFVRWAIKNGSEFDRANEQ